MTKLRIKSRQLCPHLAAAALWMSRGRSSRQGKHRIYARTYGAGMDRLIAL